MRRRLVLAIGACLVLTAAGCGGAESDEVRTGPGTGGDLVAPGRRSPAHFTGTITQVTPAAPVTTGCVPPGDPDPDGSVSSDDPPVCTDSERSPLGSILVEVAPGADGGDKVVFTILPTTQLTAGGEEIAFDALADGQTVDIGFDGLVAESYPAQATADSVEVTIPRA